MRLPPELETVRRTNARARLADKRSTRAHADRVAAVVRAHKAGYSLREIARAMDPPVTRGRVSQLLHMDKTRADRKETKRRGRERARVAA